MSSKKVPNNSTCRKYEREVLTKKWVSYVGALASAAFSVWLMAATFTNWLVGAGLLALAVIAIGALVGHLWWRLKFSGIYEKLLKRDKCTDADERLQEAARALSKELKMDVRVLRCPPSFFPIIDYGNKRFPDFVLAKAINAPGYAVVAVREVLQDNVEFWFNMWHEAAHIKQRDVLFGAVLEGVLQFTRFACCLLLGLGLSPWLGPWAYAPLVLAIAAFALEVYEEHKHVNYITIEANLLRWAHAIFAGVLVIVAILAGYNVTLQVAMAVAVYYLMLFLSGVYNYCKERYPDVFAAQKLGLDVLKPYITGEREFYRGLWHLHKCLKETLPH